ncbi:MAG: type II secretion system F family protein [Ramlibacter sp.]
MSTAADTGILFFALLVCIAVLLAFEALVLAWRSGRGQKVQKLRTRLQDLAGSLQRAGPQAVRTATASQVPLLDRHLRRFAWVRRCEGVLAQAGLRWSVANLVLASLVLALGGTIVLGIAFPTFGMLALAGGLAAGALPWLVVMRRRDKRLTRFGEQLPEALDLIARGLRAGHAFNACLKMAEEELPEPIAGELRAVHDEITYGVSLQQAFTHLSERVPSTDVRYFTVAVLVQRESGGNLTELLTKLSELIRARARLMGRVRVLSAQGRMSAWVLALMPFILGAGLYLANPGFMGPMFTDPIGTTIIKSLLFMMALGILIMRRIVRIRV